MLLQRSHLFIKQFSTSTTSSLNWRTQINQNQLASQISSILLQRHNWVPLLHTLNLSSSILTPSLFHHIILKTQTNPQISLSFFNWVKSNLGFQPPIESLCKLIQISIQSGLFKCAIPILDSMIQTQSVSAIVGSTIQACRGSDSETLVLSFVLERYSNKGLLLEGLKLFREVKFHGYVPAIHACNALLDALQRQDEMRLSWCFYGAVIRNGASPDRFTWSIIARMLSKNGKLERIVRFLDLGICNSVIYNLVIDGHCKRGDFKAAFHQLDDMHSRKFNPGFSTYSSILDGACMYGDVEVIENVVASMVEKNLLPKSFSLEYDSIVQKLCDSEKTYAAEMFFRKASDDEKIILQDATYGSMLRVLSKGRRTKEAIRVYREILEKGITVNDSACYAFADMLCKEDEQSEEVTELLREMIRKGFNPHASELSKFVTSQCDRGRWREAEDLLNAILEKGLLLDSICCSSLVKHYCSSRRIDSAMELHNKVEKLKGCFDVKTYNVLLGRLVAKKRIEEAMKVFDYMRTQSLLSSASFSIMIRALCCEKEMRRAMKLHDEMLKMGLKPDETTYKRLISGFK